MGCYDCQLSLGISISLHHDQHLPDRRASTSHPSPAEQARPHPGASSSLNLNPQQDSPQILGWGRVAPFAAVSWGIHLYVPHRQTGNIHFLFGFKVDEWAKVI